MRRIFYTTLLFLTSVMVTGCASSTDPAINPPPPPVPASLPNISLMQHCQEYAEYGLNNYFLINHKPVAERYNYLISYVQQIVYNSLKTSREHADSDKSTLSNVFIPVWITPPNWVAYINEDDVDKMKAVARWIAMNYDYKCARELLQSTHLVDTEYFYIASSLSNLSHAEYGSLMARKLSDFGKEGNEEVIDEFFKNTRQPRIWTTHNMQNVFDLLDMSFNKPATGADAKEPANTTLSGPESDNVTPPSTDSAQSPGNEQTDSTLPAVSSPPPADTVTTP